MSLTLAPEAPPLRLEPDGTIRVGQSRLTLDILVDAHRDGTTPEQLADQYSSLAVGDVYAALGYWLRHPAEVGEYLTRREAEAVELRRRIEALVGPQPSREELLARLHAKRGE